MTSNGKVRIWTLYEVEVTWKDGKKTKGSYTRSHILRHFDTFFNNPTAMSISVTKPTGDDPKEGEL